MNLTEHFTLDELVASDYALRNGLDNTPDDPQVLKHLHLLAAGLERVRASLGAPVMVSSAYRSPAVNAGVGGSPRSAHMAGLAADIYVPGLSARQVCLHLAESDGIGFDQLIFEGRWTHIAFAAGAPRGEVLTAIFKPGQAVRYVKGVA